MMRTVLDNNVIAEISDMIQRNDNNNAAIRLAEILGDEESKEQLERIRNSQERLGYMTHSNCDKRRNILHKLRNLALAQFINGEQIYQAM